MKNCSKCNTEKSIPEFAIYNGKAHCWCMVCQRENSRSYRAKFPDKIKTQGKAYRERNPSHSAEKASAWRKANPEKYRAKLREYAAKKRSEDANWDFRRNIKKFYGISVEQYESMFRAQNGVCAICSCLNISGRRLAVDHNHVTGNIRGLLCSRCNTGIGQARESVDILKKTIAYLEKHETLASIGDI